MKRKLTLFGICAVMLSGCEIINPTESLPAYIYIDELSLNTNFFNQGTNSHKITEVWVYVNGQSIGIFDLPANIPVLAEGDASVLIAAGIKNNGIASDRIRYPFYKNYETSVNLRPLETDTIRPVFSYIDNAQFIFREDFEDPGIGLEQLTGSQVDMSLVQQANQVFEGTGSGFVSTNETFKIYRGGTNNQLALNAGNRIFMELNYKTNNSFAVGIQANPSSAFNKELALIINPTQQIDGVHQWNKIYVDLSWAAGANLAANSYEIYIENVLDPGLTVSELFLDNIKVIQYQ